MLAETLDAVYVMYLTMKLTRVSGEYTVDEAFESTRDICEC